jgi:(S)-citramalyl-CoA lyase
MDNCFLYTPMLRFNQGLDDPCFGSDVVMLDLEDSTHFSAKAEARRTLMRLDLRELVARGCKFGVRINSMNTIDGIRDLDAVYTGLEAGTLAIEYLQVPKAGSAEDLVRCRAVVADLSLPLKLFPLVETPEGVEHVDEIAAESDAMLFGHVDMAASMYQPNAAYIAYARGRFCIACARAGIPAIDTTGGIEYIDDLAGWERGCRSAKEEGFTGKSMIHPKHVAITKKVFAVSPEEIENFRQTIIRYTANEAGFTMIDGRVIAPPFVHRAKMMLQLYGVEVPPLPRRRPQHLDVQEMR